jgi:hypothetical protein
MFFISFEDYMKYFNHTTICRIHDDFHFNSIKVDTTQEPFINGKPYQIINVSIKESSKIFFSVIQTSARFSGKKKGDY